MKRELAGLEPALAIPGRLAQPGSQATASPAGFPQFAIGFYANC